ncbi:MAG TPA: right-handed parallel beta-helix repeat-containing protein [Solirubrobacterales bacterium]|nr:right-handed parallel beta-helix repeat-containing protein [Solirubrobacterales bacterium]
MIIGGPASTTTSTTAIFTFSASEISSFECKLDSGSWAGCISPKIYSSLSLGSHRFSVRATDLTGNVDSTPVTRDWSVTAPDTTAPKTSIASGPESSTTATVASFSFSASESGSSFECKLDSGSWGDCTSPTNYTNLSLGSHQFSVRAEDMAGNIDKTPATLTWTIEAPAPPPPTDTTPPETTITSGPESSTTATVASFSFSASESGSSFECKLDGGSWSSCNSPAAYTGLGLGSHQFAARAKDTAGNVDATPASFGWTVEGPAPPPDTTPPETSISNGPSSTTTATSASFSFASSESGSSFECKLDSGSYASCASPKSLSGLSLGAHQFSVRATDMAGNTDSTPATQAWTVEAIAPPPSEEEPPAPSECTSTVSSTSAAQSAVSSATAGSVVCLANGKYGKVTLSASKAAPGVTLRAQNPGGATIESASLSGSHLTLARFVIPNGVVIQPGANSMTVEHNRITGGGEGIDACPTEKTWCSEMRIVGNQLVGPFGEDAIHANRYHGLYVEGNEITGVRENGAHSDCLQTVWRGDHITFRKNYLHDNRCQGFFVKDQTMSTTGLPGGPVESIIVEDNLFLRNKEPCGAPLGPSECGQPMYFQLVGPYTGFVMKRNTIWGDGVDSIAAFRGEGSGGIGSDTLVENNVIYRIWTDWNMTPATLRNNTDCMRETGTGGSWSTPTGETKACSLSFANTAADDYRIPGERGVDWAPSEQHFGP